MKTVFFNLRKVSFIAGLLFYAIFNGTTLGAQDLVSQGFSIETTFHTKELPKDLVLQGLDSVETAFHIKYEMPKGFNNPNAAQFWQPKRYSPWRTLCWVFESKDKQCKVLYNVFPRYPTIIGYNTHRSMMRREFENMLNGDNCLRILPSKEAQKRFNADSIFLYDVPTAAVLDTDDEKFTHCTRMFITKQDRPILDLVWYFTEKGKKKEKKYMQKINKHIWYYDGYGYNDGYWTLLDRQRWEEWMKICFKILMERKTH